MKDKTVIEFKNKPGDNVYTSEEMNKFFKKEKVSNYLNYCTVMVWVTAACLMLYLTLKGIFNYSQYIGG